MRKIKLKRFYEGDLQSIQISHDLLRRFKKQIGVNLFKHEHLLFSCIEYFQKQFLFLSLPPVFQRPNNDIEIYVKKYHADLFHQIKKIYKEWAKEYLLYSENEEIVTTLVLYMQSALTLQYVGKVKVLIITGFGTAWKYYISVHLKERFANMIEVVEYHSDQITQEVIDMLQVQIIITDVP
ncbi:hypothetical protein FC697_26185, partial [Bacillus wiedmannii]|uniref:hypothetical protein n=1 Tax=Bacillus wiedmannii TaxID=1890302 RepID=UPI0010BD8B41